MRIAYLVLFLLSAASIGQARTWRINAAGTGDAPNLYAAMDSAAAGDIVLLEAGQYGLQSDLIVPAGVQVVGESGPAQTLLYNNNIFSAVDAVALEGNARMSGIHVRASTEIVLFAYGSNQVSHCIVEGNLTTLDGWANPATYLHNCLFIGGPVRLSATFEGNIIVSDLTHEAIGAVLWANDVLGSVDSGIDASGTQLNFSLDPLFCGIPGSGNYYLQSTSPCLPANSPTGIPDVVGPLGAGCGAVRVEARTWGGVKALYRKP